MILVIHLEHFVVRKPVTFGTLLNLILIYVVPLLSDCDFVQKRFSICAKISVNMRLIHTFQNRLIIDNFEGFEPT